MADGLYYGGRVPVYRGGDTSGFMAIPFLVAYRITAVACYSVLNDTPSVVHSIAL